MIWLAWPLVRPVVSNPLHRFWMMASCFSVAGPFPQRSTWETSQRYCCSLRNVFSHVKQESSADCIGIRGEMCGPSWICVSPMASCGSSISFSRSSRLHTKEPSGSLNQLTSWV